jgi:hypothetical protein
LEGLRPLFSSGSVRTRAMTISSQRFYVLSSEVVGEPDQLALFDKAEREMADWIHSNTINNININILINYVSVSISFSTIGFFLVHLVYEAEQPASAGAGDAE